MKLRPIYFDLIKSGEKIYEIRLNDEKRKQIDVGDVIVFKKEPELVETINTVVEDIVYFCSFKEMVDTLPLKSIGFANADKETVQREYYRFYSPKEESEFGVVAFKVKIVK